jgi:hypothetical protein
VFFVFGFSVGRSLLYNIGYIFFADATIHLYILENLALPKLEEDFHQVEERHLITTLFLMH